MKKTTEMSRETWENEEGKFGESKTKLRENKSGR